MIKSRRIAEESPKIRGIKRKQYEKLDLEKRVDRHFESIDPKVKHKHFIT